MKYISILLLGLLAACSDVVDVGHWNTAVDACQRHNVLRVAYGVGEVPRADD